MTLDYCCAVARSLMAEIQPETPPVGAVGWRLLDLADGSPRVERLAPRDKGLLPAPGSALAKDDGNDKA